MELSCCLIVKDEEKTLGRVLECVQKFADEIVVVDTGSCDKSCEIARRYTDKLYFFEWVDDFSKARNFSFSKATKPYIMWIDADDVISQGNIEKLIDFKCKNINFDVAFLNYAIAFDENGNATFCYKRERIVKNAPQFRFVEPIHEVIVPSGKIINLDITIEHRKEKQSDPLRNLNQFERLIEKGHNFSPRLQFYYANELFYTSDFGKAVLQYEDFLSKPAFLENKLQACLNLGKCYRKLGFKDKAYSALFKSFEYDLPRAEILCELSLYLIHDCHYRRAIYWLKKAVGKPDLSKGGFVLPDCYDVVPFLNIAYCYHILGKKSLAVHYCKKALQCKPNDEQIKNYLEFYEKNMI